MTNISKSTPYRKSTTAKGVSSRRFPSRSRLRNQYRILRAEKEHAERAYRTIHRNQTLYSEEERRFWTFRLASIIDRLEALEQHLCANEKTVVEGVEHGKRN